MLRVVQPRQQLHRVLPSAPAQHPAGEQLYGVHRLQPLDHVQDQHSARRAPPRHVQVVCLERVFDHRERFVVGLYLLPVLVRQVRPVQHAEQAEPRFRVPQRVVGGPHHPVCQVPVRVLVWVEGREECPPVYVLEREDQGLDRECCHVPLVYVVLVAELQQTEYQVSVAHFVVFYDAFIILYS